MCNRSDTVCIHCLYDNKKILVAGALWNTTRATTCYTKKFIYKKNCTRIDNIFFSYKKNLFVNLKFDVYI